MFNQSHYSNNFMKMSYLNLDLVNLNDLHKVKDAYPVALPVIMKESEDNVLVKPICSKKKWIKEGSLNVTLETDSSSEKYITLNKAVFEKEFTKICDNFFIKKPKPVLSLKLCVPCVFTNNKGELCYAMPSDYVVLNNDNLVSFSEEDFNRLFTSTKELSREMNIKITPKRQPSLELSIEP